YSEPPGMPGGASKMPSGSVSTLKFLKAMCCSQIRSLRGVGKRRALRAVPTVLSGACDGGHGAESASAHPMPSDSFDDRRGAHAAADAQRHQRSLLIGALEFVEHGAEDHRTRCPQRMAERNRAAIDVDLGVVDVEGLDVAQHDRSKRLVQLEQVDVGLLHAGTLEQLFGDVDRAGQ